LAGALDGSSVHVPEKSGFWADADIATARIAAVNTPTRAAFMCLSLREAGFCIAGDRASATAVPTKGLDFGCDLNPRPEHGVRLWDRLFGSNRSRMVPGGPGR
jgi:hypothetical protein